MQKHPKVTWVSYAGLPGHPQHAFSQMYMTKGPGAVFSFGIKAATNVDARATGKRFIEGLQIFSHLANIGDVRSLVIHPASTTNQQLTDEELAAAGVGPELIRLSVGLENTEDLLWDLEQSFHAP